MTTPPPVVSIDNILQQKMSQLPPPDDSTTTTIAITTATTNTEPTAKSEIYTLKQQTKEKQYRRHLIEPLLSYDEGNIDTTSRQRRHDKNPSDRNKQAYYNDDNNCEPDNDGVFGNSQNTNGRVDVTFRYEIETDTNSNPRKFGKNVLPRLEMAIGRSVYEYGSISCRRRRRRRRLVRRRMEDVEMIMMEREGGGVRRRLATVGVDPRPRDVILKDEKCHTPLSRPVDRCFVIQGGMSVFLSSPTSLTTNHNNHGDLERAFLQLIAHSMNQGYYNDGSIDREIRRVSFIPREEWYADGISSSLMDGANWNSGTDSGGGMFDSPSSAVTVNNEELPSETFILRMIFVGASVVLLLFLPCAMLLRNMKKKIIDEKKAICPWSNTSSTTSIISNTTATKEELPVLLLDKPITRTTMNDKESEGVVCVHHHYKSSAEMSLSQTDDASSTTRRGTDDYHDEQPLSWKDVDTLDDDESEGLTTVATSLPLPVIDGNDDDDEVTIKFQNHSLSSNSSSINKNTTTALETINERDPSDGEMMKNSNNVTIAPLNNNMTIDDTKNNNYDGDVDNISSSVSYWKNVEYIAVQTSLPTGHRTSSDENGSQTYSSPSYGSSQYDFYRRQPQQQEQRHDDNKIITSTTPSNYFKQAWEYIIDNGSSNSKSLTPSSSTSGYGSSQYDFSKRLGTDDDDDKTPLRRGDGKHQQLQEQGMMTFNASHKNDENE